MNELQIVSASEFGLEENKAEEITRGLTTIIKERELLKDTYVEVMKLEVSEENIPTFKQLRLDIRSNRTKGIEVWHKTNKAFFLHGGRFVDAIKNKEVAENERVEWKLLEAEKHFENLEKEKIEELRVKRELEISKYQDEEDLLSINLGEMSENVWNNYIAGAKSNYESRIRAEKEAEAERKAKEEAEIAERKRIREENERLLKEAEKREKLAKIEQEKRDKLERERLAKEKREKLEREKETKRLQDIADAKLKKEAYEKAKLQAVLKVKQLEAERLEAERLANIEFELNKGDSDKVKDLILDLEGLKNKYTFKSKANKNMYVDVNELIDKVISFISKD